MPATKKRELDLSEFPPGTITEYTTLVCLACIFDIFTKQLGLAPRTAFSEVKRHTPTIKELTSRSATRPYFDSEEKSPHCPYCGSAKRWLARFDTYCIEGGKTTDAARRNFLKKLPTAADLFLAPSLYGEAILIQYFVSRSHAHGGLTLEGRITLMELIRQLRYIGYLEH